MRTARLLPVSPSMHCSGGGVPGPGGYLVPEGEYLVPGGVPDPRGVYLDPGGTCPGTSPPVNRMTDRCKNITLPQTSFRTVTMGSTVLNGCIYTCYLVNIWMDWKVQ